MIIARVNVYSTSLVSSYINNHDHTDHNQVQRTRGGGGEKKSKANNVCYSGYTNGCRMVG